MKINQLRSFLAVAEHGSIRGAARALGITQPAVTQAMRELEASLDVPLLLRSSLGVELTVYGKALARRGNLIHREIEQALSEIHQIRDGSMGLVSAAMSTAVALEFLPSAFNDFRSRFPLVELRLGEASLPSTLPRLVDGSVDFMVSHLLPGTLPGWDVQRLYSTSMVLAARKGHPVQAATKVEDFDRWEWLLPYDGSAPEILLQLFEQKRLPVPKRIVRCTSSAMALRLVGSSDLVSVFVDTMTPHEFPHYGIAKVPFGDPLASLEVSVISRPGAILSPAATSFLACLRAAMPKT